MPSPYYDQGRRDAENGTLNQLFYHTYHDYKRGYDEIVNGPPKPKPNFLFFLIPALLLVGLAGGWFLRDRGVLSTPPTPLVVMVTVTPVTASPTFPPFAIATPAPPTPTQLVIEIGGEAITLEQVRIRPDPSIQGEPIGALDPGELITIIDGPRQGDDYTWWLIESAIGQGWVAEDFIQAR
ncbi:MAG TPA: SH3 domain-containing protein [Herpetosiphon sp.]|uniref:SH3b domain-containing protein n=1 Tax=Herpetosiphon aurantiacus (strain ATCC 23779 / DSM 785 / 114-95) TaxID=316274 RepID=A9B6H2_HERA2|nr:SH3 domain-containing protein [Herpetosiphon sp.]ABX02875.1 conserved hypothetical protein [Herpetosiphon aurantiacus DSM 785]MCA0352528.1 SH3 domain-containing protein [Chloroflexota bacterium]HBW53014.1 SH3 domain-containing protein [Herpetosiphon sp.]